MTTDIDMSAAEAIAQGRAWAFWIDASPWKKTGKWVPSVIVEGVAGHTPMAGDPAKLQQPWFWGDSYEEARQHCEQVNLERGILPDEMVRILLSSMAAQRAAEGRG